jgi:putative FmdB family regulatory protein
MPIYSYRCDACAHEFELRQGFDASTRQECPQCSNSASRMFHPVGVIYKGSGFYTTDYRKKESGLSSSSNSSTTSAEPPSASSSSPASSSGSFE